MSCGSSPGERAAAMSSTASAPMHRASRTSAGATVKSLRNTGKAVAARAATRSSGDPAKNSRSVSTDKAAAPLVLIGAGQAGRIEVRGERSLARAGPLDLGDHGHPGAGRQARPRSRGPGRWPGRAPPGRRGPVRRWPRPPDGRPGCGPGRWPWPVRAYRAGAAGADSAKPGERRRHRWLVVTGGQVVLVVAP